MLYDTRRNRGVVWSAWFGDLRLWSSCRHKTLTTDFTVGTDKPQANLSEICIREIRAIRGPIVWGYPCPPQSILLRWSEQVWLSKPPPSNPRPWPNVFTERPSSDTPRQGRPTCQPRRNRGVLWSAWFGVAVGSAECMVRFPIGRSLLLSEKNSDSDSPHN